MALFLSTYVKRNGRNDYQYGIDDGCVLYVRRGYSSAHQALGAMMDRLKSMDANLSRPSCMEDCRIAVSDYNGTMYTLAYMLDRHNIARIVAINAENARYDDATPRYRLKTTDSMPLRVLEILIDHQCDGTWAHYPVSNSKFINEYGF